jgi:selenocysteine-specific elongation factor
LIKVRFHHGTSEILARVALLAQDTLQPGHSAYAQLRLEEPAFCLHGDRFIIRQFSPTITIGGGTVLDPHPTKHKTTNIDAAALLQDLATVSAEEKIPLLMTASDKRAIDLRALNSRLGWPEAQLRDFCMKKAKERQLLLVPGPVPILMLPAVVEALEKETVAILKEFHQQNPLLKGISREELRKRIYDDLPPEVFRFCLEELVKKKQIALQEELVAEHGREVQLSAEGQQVRELIEASIRSAGYQPPPLSELTVSLPADPEQVRKIYYWMLKEKILVKITEDLAYHRLTLDEIKSKIHGSFAPGSRFGVAEFKELFDLTRKHAIPLLEFLDREKFTRRQGNDRIIL